MLACSVVLVTTACASEPTPTTSAHTSPSIIVTVAEEGGCFMMGLNCATYHIWNDGTVDLFRTGDPDHLVHTTTIDPSLVARIADELATTDLASLRTTLPEGECRGCYDGIDIDFWYGSTGFSSVDVELVKSEPLFDVTWEAFEAAAASTELPVEARQ